MEYETGLHDEFGKFGASRAVRGVCYLPINERTKDTGAGLSKSGGQKKWKRELDVLLDKWKVGNYGRVLVPLVAGVVGWLGVVKRGRLEKGGSEVGWRIQC